MQSIIKQFLQLNVPELHNHYDVILDRMRIEFISSNKSFLEIDDNYEANGYQLVFGDNALFIDCSDNNHQEQDNSDIFDLDYLELKYSNKQSNSAHYYSFFCECNDNHNIIIMNIVHLLYVNEIIIIINSIFPANDYGDIEYDFY